MTRASRRGKSLSGGKRCAHITHSHTPMKSRFWMLMLFFGPEQEKRAAEMDRVERDRLYERERDAERERDRESSKRTRRSSHAPADHEDSEMLDAGAEDGSRRRRSSRASGALAAAGHDEDGAEGVPREHRKRAASSASAADLHGSLNAGCKEEGDEERGPERKVPRLEKAGDDMSMTVSPAC